MDMREAMAARKTIREFSPRPVEMETIRGMIAAGFTAPTNNHMREWHFILLQDREARRQLLNQVIKPISARGAVGIVNRWGLTDPKQRHVYLDAIPRQYSMLLSAPCLIIPCWHQPYPLLKPESLSALNPFASIWCCLENMLLAAAAEGIFGVTRIPMEDERETIKQSLNLPAEYEVPCWLALGYPAEGVERIPQVEIDLDERIHLERW